MKKFVLVVVFLYVAYAGQMAFGHAAKTEIAKDDTMIKLDQQVDKLITENGDFTAALELYAKVAKSNTSQPYYKEQYSILRRVIKMNQAIEATISQELNEASTKALTGYFAGVRGYYYSRGYYGLAVALDKQAADKLGGADNQLAYLESLVAAGENAQAGEYLAGGAVSGADNTHLAVLKALVSTRGGQAFTDWPAAEQWQQELTSDPLAQVYIACLYKSAGKQEQSFASLVQALEQTPPTQMAVTKNLIAAAAEFSDSADNKDYLAALSTQSKVYQSGCTGGSSCNSCSLKDSCSSQK